MATSVGARAALPDTEPDWVVASGQGSAFLGDALATGDVDGDGFDDLLAGAPEWDSGGQAFLYVGAASVPSEVAAWTSGEGQAELGGAVALGDVDGDGFADAVLTDDPAMTRVLLYLGGPTGLSAIPDWRTEAEALFATRIALAPSPGDLDGDGISDLVVGTPYWESGEGRALVFLGSAAGPGSAPDWTYEPNVANVYLGDALCSGGDVDADGYDDLLVGVEEWTDPENDEGGLFLFAGSVAGPAASPTWSVASDQDYALLGSSVDMGDVDGDGHDDVVAGVTGWDVVEGDDGAAFLYLGSAGGPSAVADWTYEAANETRFGTAVGVADVDGDGYGDVLAGSGHMVEGTVYAFLGSADGASLAPDWSAEGGVGAVLATGDVDGDGYDDVATKAGDAGGPTYEGAVLLFRGATRDGDGDGYESWAGTDCDDGDAGVHPDAIETCDSVDEDCDAVVDDADSWADTDGDGYGDGAISAVGCPFPGGFVDNDLDCDDALPAVSPAATELCNGLDDDCDALTDEPDAADAPTWYADLDADGHGDPLAATVVACMAPAGFVADATDCDDTAAAVSPSTPEACNGVDDDCDALTDEPDAVDAGTWYTDADGDGTGDPSTAAPACTGPEGTVADGTDCDDADPAVHVGAVEVCDGIDDDCDGQADEPDAADAATWFADRDGDGHGDASGAVVACSPPAGFVADATDCDDADAQVHPGAVEACNGVDDDCDAAVDEECRDGVDDGCDGEACAPPGGCGCAQGTAPGAAALLVALAALGRRRAAAGALLLVSGTAGAQDVGDYLNVSFSGDGETPTHMERLSTAAQRPIAGPAGGVAGSPRGDASYSIPLALPPARLAPTVSLDYTSGAPGGRVGLGWSLSVGPSIRPGPRTRTRS